ncbi:hypothetical protein Tco_0140887 [Tanacetum coccineum]
MLPYPRFLIYQRGKIQLRTQSVINGSEYKSWKRLLPQYLPSFAEDKEAYSRAAFKSLHYRLYTFHNKSWVYDTGCGTYICNTTQGLTGSRQLKPGSLSLYAGNGQCAVVKAIGSYLMQQKNKLNLDSASSCALTSWTTDVRFVIGLLHGKFYNSLACT